MATEVEVEKLRKEEKLRRKVAMPSLTAAEREVNAVEQFVVWLSVNVFVTRLCG